MNKFMIIGRIAKDIDTKTINNDKVVARFTMAVDRKRKTADGEKQTDFFNVVAWQKLGENISKYCKKGSKVYVEGELQNRNYEDKDGNKRYTTEIIASACEFLETKKVEEETNKQELAEISEDTLPF